MENVIIKYSDFILDDGGFDKARADVVKFGDDIVDEAKKIKKEFQKAFNMDDLEGMKEFEEKAESITDLFKKQKKSLETLDKAQKEYLENQENATKSTEDQLGNLVKLDKKLAKHKSELKEVNKLLELGVKTDRDLNKERVEAQLNIKKVNAKIREQQKEILKVNTLSAKENKLLKAKITLEKTEIKTLDDVRERMSALRLVVQTLDINEQADEIKAFNEEINELTGVLGENSDKFIQSKINIGNYEESITNALKGTSAFNTNVGVLDQAIGSLVNVLTLTNAELEVMEAQLGANSKALKRFIVGWKSLNTVLKASIIGAVLIALVAVASAFSDTRAGAIRMEKAMSVLSNSWTLFSQRVGIVVSGIGEVLGLFFSGKFGQASKAWDKTMLKSMVATASSIDAIVEGLDNIERAFQIEDNVRRLTQEVERLNGELEVTQGIADDSTKSLTTQLLASKKALELIEDVAKRESEIAQQNLELANERVKQNIKANGIEVLNIDLSKKGTDFAQATLDLAQQRGASLEISNDLLDAQQQAVLEVIKAENKLQKEKQDNAKITREINRDIFEQNLDLLIDLIDTEKNLSEQFVNDVTKNFEKRVNEFNRFLIRFRANAQKELDEFTKEAQNLELDLDFEAQFDENGNLKVFVNDSELATDNIVELNKQLQGFGLNEIDINRFREFIVESRNGVKDFRDLNKELKLVGINVKQLSSNIEVTQDELNALKQLENQILKLGEAQKKATSTEEQQKITKQIEELENQKTAITEFAEMQRIQNQKDAIDAELETVEEGSVRYLELIQQRLDLEKQLRETGIDDVLDKTKEANKKSLEDYKRFASSVRKVLDTVLDKVTEVNQKRVEKAEEQVDKQGELIDVQQRRAEQGLENTLAFEQRELGKREADLIKRQKKQERLEKIKAIYSAYNNYAGQGDKNPITKALRDFALLEAITASFGDGGIVGIDGVKTNQFGITQGRSHNSDGSGGMLAFHEGGEGFFSRDDIKRMGGQENFYKMKDLASQGKIDSNFFSGQGQKFIQAIPFDRTNHQLISEMKEVKKAIEAKPTQNWDVPGFADGVLEMVETVMSKNKTTRNHYKTRKPLRN